MNWCSLSLSLITIAVLLNDADDDVIGISKSVFQIQFIILFDAPAKCCSKLYNNLHICSKSHQRMGKRLPMNFSPQWERKRAFNSIPFHFTVTVTVTVRVPQIFSILATAIFKSTDRFGIFRRFCFLLLFFVECKHRIQLFCCRLKRFSIVISVRSVIYHSMSAGDHTNIHTKC